MIHLINCFPVIDRFESLRRGYTPHRGVQYPSKHAHHNHTVYIKYTNKRSRERSRAESPSLDPFKYPFNNKYSQPRVNFFVCDHQDTDDRQVAQNWSLTERTVSKRWNPMVHHITTHHVFPVTYATTREPPSILSSFAIYISLLVRRLYSRLRAEVTLKKLSVPSIHLV